MTPKNPKIKSGIMSFLWSFENHFLLKKIINKNAVHTTINLTIVRLINEKVSRLIFMNGKASAQDTTDTIIISNS